MPFLKLLHTANVALSTVESGRNLARSRSSASSNPERALAQAIDSMHNGLSSQLDNVRDVLQQDVQTVLSMVQQIIAQQNVLHQEIQQVISGVVGLKQLMMEHMNIMEDQLQFLIDQPLQEAIYKIKSLVSNTTGVRPELNLSDVAEMLLRMENWIVNIVISHKMATLSSEAAIRVFSQSSDNLGFVARRLHLLFGEFVHELKNFISLPPVSLDFYLVVVTFYLAGLEKYPQVLSENKATHVCTEIENTLKTYLEFIKFIKHNESLIQALFDQYHYYQVKNSSQDSFFKEELKELIKAQLPLIDNEKFNAQFTELETSSLKLIPVNKSTDIWDHLKELPEDELVKSLFGIAKQGKNVNLANSKYMILPKAMKYEELPKYLCFYDGGVVEWGKMSPYGSDAYMKKPKPAAFYTPAMLILCLASNYATIDFFKNSTLKNHAWSFIQVFGRRPDEGPYYPDPMKYRSDIYWNSPRTTTGADLRPYLTKQPVFNGHKTEYHRIWWEASDILPPDYLAILTSATNGILKLNKLQNAFQFCNLFSNGELQEAKIFVEQNEVDHTCLLFLVSIIGEWRIFENFVKLCPLPKKFRFYKTIEGTSLSAGMFALNLSHQEVWDEINALCDNLPKVSLELTVSESEKEIQKISEVVTASKTKLAKYVPPAPLQSAASVTQPVLSEEDPAEITSDEMEGSLHKVTREFFDELKIHPGKGGAFCWRKPQDRKYRRTGNREIDDTEFQNEDQRNSFFARLDKQDFRVKRLKAEKKLLVKLPLMS